MSRHCVQIKSMLESKRLSKSKFNIQLSTKHLPEPTPQIKQLKRSQSSSSLIKQGTSEIFLIEERYRKLEQNYRSILQETRNNSMLFAKQKTELERLKIENSKDKKQIERLRKMLGFVKECKVQKGVQVQRQMEERTSYDKDLSKISNDSKVEQSTDAGSRDTQDNWKVKETRKSTKKQSRVKTPYKLLNNKSQTTIFMRSPLKQSNITKSPLSRYKFVPTISFN